MEPIETYEYRGYTIEVYHDDIPGDGPREWDNLGTMVCWHSRYNLGDKQIASPYGYYDAEEWARENMPPFGDIAVLLGLNLYDHGGISMTTLPFDGWDSGHVGFIYVTKDQVREEYSKQRISKKLRKLVEQVLEGEVRVYDMFLRGAVYGYVVKDSNGDEIEYGSCWGFYGWDHEESGLMESAEMEIDGDLERIERERREEIKQHGEYLKRAIKSRVPLVYRENCPVV